MVASAAARLGAYRRETGASVAGARANNAGIAACMQVTLPTVALHLINARKKLGAQTREQAVAQAVKRGLIEP
jgi:DNA-binding CsgD family transcriptional regulator